MIAKITISENLEINNEVLSPLVVKVGLGGLNINGGTTETKETIETKLLAANLNTTSKEIVGAINEVNAKPSGGGGIDASITFETISDYIFTYYENFKIDTITGVGCTPTITYSNGTAYTLGATISVGSLMKLTVNQIGGVLMKGTKV